MNDLEMLLDRIEELPSGQIWEVLEMAIERYRIVFPDREILLMSLPKGNTPERRQQIETLQKYLLEGE